MSIFLFLCRVMGTSVNLKNRFAGYNIELVVLNEDVQEVANLVLEHLPGEMACVDTAEYHTHTHTHTIFPQEPRPRIQWRWREGCYCLTTSLLRGLSGR